MNPLALLGAWWVKPLAVAIAVAAVVAWLFHVKHNIEDAARAPLIKELKLSADQLTACRKHNEEMAAGVLKQNSAIEAMQANADKRLADSAKAVADARQLTTQSNQRVKDILASAPLSNDLCESARLRMVPR